MSRAQQILANMRKVRVFTCTEVVACEGEGVQESPAREVRYYYDGDKFLFAADPEGTIRRPCQCLRDVNAPGHPFVVGKS